MKTLYLTTGDEVGEDSEIHTTFEAATASGNRFIDKFIAGKHVQTYERKILDDNTGEFLNPPEYR